MSSAIIGFGAIGQALARAFARKNIQVSVAARRPPEAIAPLDKAIGGRLREGAESYAKATGTR